jgi:hypothetical protein
MIAVVGIFVAAANLVCALAHQFDQLVVNVCLASRIVNRPDQSSHQADLLVDFPHVQYAAIGTDTRLIKQCRDTADAAE